MITVVGSLNLDFFIETPRLPSPGETILGRRFRSAPGGKGANQACAIARLSTASASASTHFLGCAGDDDFGRRLSANLGRFGVRTDGLIQRRQAASGVAFIAVDDDGANQIIVASGANATLTPNDIEQHRSLLEKSQIVVAQLEVPLPAIDAALRIAHSAGAVTILNPAPATTLPDELLRCCHWIIPNESEAAHLSGRPLRTPEEAPNVASALRARAPHAGIIITLGAEGAWLDCGQTGARIASFPVQAVDTVGAGDAFVGGFAVALSEGAQPHDAAVFASAVAALAVTRPGAQDGLPSRSEVDRLLATAPGRSVGVPRSS